MADMLKDGLAWLDDERDAHMTSSYTYQRGPDDAELNATKGRNFSEEQDESGAIIQTQSQDWLIRAADIVLDGVETLPAIGDRIVEIDVVGRTITYEVLSEHGEPQYRFSDHDRRVLRVHTKQISVEEP